MALHDDLLEQAQHLATRDRTRPRQASLRRSLSAAYYALFHLLASEIAKAIAPTQPAGLARRVERALNHADMKTVCRQFGSGNVAQLAEATRNLVQAPLAAELISVANTFAFLQEERLRADYDTSHIFLRLDTVSALDLTEQAFQAWSAVRQTPNANVFLAALLLQRHWSK